MTETEVLKAQVKELNQALQASLQNQVSMRQIFLARGSSLLGEVLDGLNLLSENAESGDPMARERLQNLFAAFERARSIAASRIIVPPHTHRSPANGHEPTPAATDPQSESPTPDPLSTPLRVVGGEFSEEENKKAGDGGS